MPWEWFRCGFVMVLEIVGWFGDGLAAVGGGLGLVWGWFGAGLGAIWGAMGR